MSRIVLFVASVDTIGLPTDLCFISVTFLFIYLFLFIALRSQDQLMDVSILRTVGVGCNFIVFVIGFVCSSLYCRGDGEIAPNVAQNMTVPSFGALS